jgi:leader peptidase (prepilin peptidase)/N-methyltransferase
LVELGTAGLFCAFAVRFGAHAALPAFLYLAAVGIALAMIDFDAQRLPDKLTLPSYPVALVLLGLAALADGAGWPYARALIGMATLFGFYAALWFVYPAGMGLGDVKLSGVLGLFLGWLSWRALIVGAASAFLVGAVVSIAILMLVKGSGRKTKVPFGPFMLLGVLIATFAANPIAHAYLHSFNR